MICNYAACVSDGIGTDAPGTDSPLPTSSSDQQACIAERSTEQFTDILSDCGQDLLIQLETNVSPSSS